ncbi:RDD family protein [Cellulomonas sp. URHB0016]
MQHHPPASTADDAALASLGRRAVAYLVDQAVVLALGGWLVLRASLGWTADLRAAAGEGSGAVAAAPSGPAVVAGTVLVSTVLVVQWLTLGRSGWTVGRLFTGLRTLDVETRRPIGLARALVRGLVLVAGALACVLGLPLVLASPLLDRTGRRRGWLDLAAQDEVLDVRGGRVAERAAALAVPASTPWPPDGNEHVEPKAVTAQVPAWAGRSSGGTEQLDAWLDEGAQPALVLAPLAPRRRGPDLDTRAVPLVRPASDPATVEPAAEPLVGRPGLDPQVEATRRVAPRGDLVAEDHGGGALRPASAEIELSDGRLLTIERTALVGRNPAADVDVQLVRVVDPDRSVSKTHLQIGVELGGVWIADRGSTNGTVVTLPDGAQVVCGADQQVRLRVGSTVTFGDCSLRLVRAPGLPTVS